MDVDGITVARALAIENASVVSGYIAPGTGHLILVTQGGTEEDAGLVVPVLPDPPGIQVANIAARPAAGIQGRYCFVEDTDRFFYDDGVTWNEYANVKTIPFSVVKTTDESVTSSTALQDDDELFFAVEANKKYVVRGLLSFRQHAAVNAKVGWSLPAGATMSGKFGTALGEQFRLAVSDAFTTCLLSGSVDEQFEIAFLFEVGATAGNVKLRWAQSASNGAPVWINATSHIQVQRV